MTLSTLRDEIAGEVLAVAQAAAAAVYGPEALARLVGLKRRFDPENVLRLSHNIPPG